MEQLLNKWSNYVNKTYLLKLKSIVVARLVSIELHKTRIIVMRTDKRNVKHDLAWALHTWL